MLTYSFFFPQIDSNCEMLLSNWVQVYETKACVYKYTHTLHYMSKPI